MLDTITPRRARRDQMLTSERHKANQLVSEWLTSIGAQGPDQFARFTVQTILGGLDVTPCGDWVACRFHDVERAVAKLGRDNMNPYSGKWNHHYFGRQPGSEVLLHFQLVLTPLLPVNP